MAGLLLSAGVAVMLAAGGAVLPAVARAAPDTAQPDAPLVVDEGAVPPDLLAAARAVADQPLGQRMLAISDVLMGQPYQVDAAGEGRAPDFDPPARYDAFDCLTLVEEVLALALPADPISAPMVRNGLRYGGAELSYDNRRHFMLTEWIPGAIADGWVEDITGSLGETHLVEVEITPDTWTWWRRRSLFHLADERLPSGRYELPVMSIDAALEAAADIPDGALIITVRRPKPGVPIVVTHLGFKIPSSADRPMMRHATKMRGQRVMDHSLLWYLDHLRWYHNWPVEGVAVLMPREFGPRAHLAAPQKVLTGVAQP